MADAWLVRASLCAGGLAAYLLAHRFLSAGRGDPYTMLVLGSGGHTTELLKAMEYAGEKFSRRCYVIADTDRLSEGKIREKEPRVIRIPRAREVHQSYATSVFTTLRAIFCAFFIVGRERPSFLIVNGPGTCLPLVLACWAYRLLGLRVRIVSLEALTRARTLSLTTKLCYPFVDRHVVMWKGQYESHRRLRKLVHVNVFNE